MVLALLEGSLKKELWMSFAASAARQTAKRRWLRNCQKLDINSIEAGGGSSIEDLLPSFFFKNQVHRGQIRL